MEKLTYIHPSGKVWLKECEHSKKCDEDCFYCQDGIMQRAMEMLAKYESLDAISKENKTRPN